MSFLAIWSIVCVLAALLGCWYYSGGSSGGDYGELIGIAMRIYFCIACGIAWVVGLAVYGLSAWLGK